MRDQARIHPFAANGASIERLERGGRAALLALEQRDVKATNVARARAGL